MKIYLIPSFHYDNTWHLSSYAYAKFTSERIIKTAVDILKKERDFHFTVDHLPSLEDFLKRYPEESKYLKKEIKKGRVEIAGLMYTQMDCLIPSGESFVSQILYGKKWISSLLDASPTTEWLVDIYGYCDQLPQILKRAGIEHLVIALWWLRGDEIGLPTDKKGKDYLNNNFPQADFLWEAPDGSRILVHNSPDYGGLFFPGDKHITGCPCSFGGGHNRKKKIEEFHSPDSFKKAKDAFVNLYKELVDERESVLFMHMGGDFREPHIANITYIKKLNEDKTIPRINLAIPQEYFKKVIKKHLPIFKGEINPIYPGRFGEGYYETKIKIKQLNRKFEYNMIRAQVLASLTSLFGEKYPKEEIEKSWKAILFYQHHDPFIGNIPKREYNLLIRKWEDSIRKAEQIIDRSSQYLSSQIDTYGQKEPFIIFNTLGWRRKGLIPINKGTFFFCEIPPFGYKVIDINKKGELDFPQEISLSKERDYFHITNQFYEVKVNAVGDLVNLFDKEIEKEIFKDKSFGNELILEEDLGCFCYNRPTGKRWQEEIEKSTWIKENSKFKITLLSRVRIKDIKFEKELIFKSFDKRIDLKVTVFLPDGEDLRLKVLFPVNFEEGKILAESPFGWTKREEGVSPMINWVDYSNDKFGLTLFNRGIPGYEAKAGNLTLHLIKGLSLKEPHRACLPPSLREKMIEKGKFQFNYGICPHGKNPSIERIVKEGYEFNFPLSVIKATSHKGELPSEFNLLQIEPFNLIGYLIKRAEAGDDLILRLYEIKGKKTLGRIKFSVPVKTCILSDILEKEEREVPIKNKEIRFQVKPHEIITLRIKYEKM